MHCAESLPDGAFTRLERRIRASLARDCKGWDGDAGVAVISDPTSAFTVRADSARDAERSLDLQYYIWRADLSGQLLAEEAVRAADRGVKVRLLLDGIYAPGRERTLAALNGHPGIEVRLFNGARWRIFGRFSLLLELAFGNWRLNRRMHNKAWIADGSLAVVGGRNIGDEYFGVGSKGSINFRDHDLLIAGPAAAQALQVFNRYWTSRLARPVDRPAVAAAGQNGGLAALRQRLADNAARPEAQGLLATLAGPEQPWLGLALTSVGRGAVRVAADPPEKALRGLGSRKRARAAGGIAADIADSLRVARREVLLISPYFVPGRAGLALLQGLRARGVRVSVVTNSLAATDVVAVHGGYAKYRRPLLEAGVELFELKSRSTGEHASLIGSRGASLHTKAFVVDGAHAFVGSFNLDPRSALLNTEMGVHVWHHAVAQEVADDHARLADPALSWRIVSNRGALGWCDGATIHRHEPAASRWRRIAAWLVQGLPIEEQL